uniref:TolC family protein n=1 Tax=Fusobacterium sp. TaxID=68766 RepID=UPI0026177DC6
LIKLILSENSDLKIAWLNMEKSTEAINLVKSQEGFHLDFTGNFKRERITKNGIEPPPLGGKIYNMSSLGLQSSYNVDIFNKFKSLSEEQRYKSEAIKINSKWIELNIAERTTKLYIYWKYLQEEEGNLREQREILARIKNLYRESINIGTGIEENYLTIENNLRVLDSIIAENKMNQDITINNLNLLSGNKKIEEIKSLLTTDKKNMEESFEGKIKIPQSINSDVVVERPDIKYYLMLIEAQKEHLKSAKADFYPQFTINGGIGLQSLNLNTLLEKNSLLGFIGPSLYLPIFHQGSIRSNYKIAGIDLNIFIEEYNKAVINAYNEIGNEIYTVKTLENSLLNSDINILNEKKILDENKKRLNIGTISEYNYLLDRYNFMNKSLLNKQDHFKFYIQQLDFIKAVGGVYKK